MIPDSYFLLVYAEYLSFDFKHFNDFKKSVGYKQSFKSKSRDL